MNPCAVMATKITYLPKKRRITSTSGSGYGASSWIHSYSTSRKHSTNLSRSNRYRESTSRSHHHIDNRSK